MTKTEMEIMILELKLEMNKAVETMDEFREYLLSPKFDQDPTVQTSDVLRRLNEIKLRYFPFFPEP